MSRSVRLTGRDRTLVAIVAITAVALLARLVFLGARIAHWDEGRVGYDILRYMATGAWQYRAIVHGPFLAHVNRIVFLTLGPSDFSARLVVAVIGALLPLSAWLYREHLRDVELVALALFLAFDPILLYYSRFMRNDVLLATFAFAALGFYIRTLDTGKARYLFVGTACLGLAFTTKENAIVYVAAWLGALFLLLDHRLFLARTTEDGWTTVARRVVGRTARGLWAWRLPLAVAVLEFVVIWIFFYAPREAADGGIGLWAAFAHPSTFPQVIAAATYNPASCSVAPPATASPYCNGAIERIIDLWFGGSNQNHSYLPFFGDYVKTLGSASGPLALLAVIGFVSDRYAGERPRDLVAMAFYWGFVSVLGYPIAVDIRAAWTVTHAVVPLAIPAAVGVGLIWDWGREAYAANDRVSVGLAAVVLLLVGGQIAATAVTTSYLEPQGPNNMLVQYAQPAGDLHPALALVSQAARNNRGLDVVWYGSYFLVEDETKANRLPIGDGDWYHRLPLPWYLEIDNATVTSTASARELTSLVATQHPPVIITREQDAPDIEGQLSGYREFTAQGRQPVGGKPSMTFVFFIDERYAGNQGTAPGANTSTG